jgi:hypothetical protein
MSKKSLPHAPWCYGYNDEEYSGWDCPTRESAIEEALSENDEADNIYLAQYLPMDRDLDIETDVEELLGLYAEHSDCCEEMGDRLQDKKDDLSSRLAPLFAEIQVTFRRWLKDHSLEVFDFYNEEEFSREQAQREVRDALSVHEARGVALAQIGEQLGWLEGYLERNDSHMKDEAIAALERIRAIVEETKPS